MSREAIAIDLDEVVVETAVHIVQVYNQIYNTNCTPEDYYRSCDELDMWVVRSNEELQDRLRDIYAQEAFFAIPPKDDATVAISALKRTFELHVVTARSEFIAKNTKDWLHKHFPGHFETINFTSYYDPNVTTSGTKGEICDQLAVTCLVDDHPKHAFSAAAKGICTLLFGDYSWNRHFALPDNVFSVRNWDEVIDLLNAQT